jgi:hypothetical protein
MHMKNLVFGMFLGILVTVAAAFAYDSVSGRAPNGLARSAADGRPPVVNWDVVSEDWHQLELSLQSLGEDVQRGWRKLWS